MQRVVIHGKRRDIGLGSVRWLSLTEAREIALENWKAARRGGDPMGSRRSVPSFEEAAELVIAAQRAGWRDHRSEAQWRASLRDYVYPRFGDRRVDQITTAEVLSALLPHWHDKFVTMKRVQQRISAIMKFSIAKGYRDTDPAGPELTAALPKNGTRKVHLKALPHSKVGAALASVRAADARPDVKLALEFAVLTAARSGEVRGAAWNEIDLDAATWTVPAGKDQGRRRASSPVVRTGARNPGRSARPKRRRGARVPRPCAAVKSRGKRSVPCFMMRALMRPRTVSGPLSATGAARPASRAKSPRRRLRISSAALKAHTPEAPCSTGGAS